MRAYLQNKYKGKRVFVTGHTGFKGAWLVQLLSMLGAEVKGYALEPYTKDDVYNIVIDPANIHSVIGDLRNNLLLEKELLSFQPDYIFHLAAQPLVRLSYEIPAETFEINAIGTAYLLDSVKKLEKPCSVILITTDKVYHNYEWLYPYRENDRLGGYDPYSASKACAELVIDSYRNSFFNKQHYARHQKGIAVARAGNVIGGGDWAKDRLIPDIARALGSDLPFVMRNPQAVRPWQHVLEPLTGYLLLGGKLSEEPQLYSDAFNFGPNASDTLTVKEMAGIAIDCWGSGQFEVVSDKAQPHEAGLLKLDISKAQAQLDWHPVLNAKAAVTLSMEWYKTFFKDKTHLKDLTNEQINSFLQKTVNEHA
ncbi:MAG: CDP-glucose 4,6-dehydratase [Filimonas sp.]|nr:CDP-glucose 4,6-dehydratase [Filimonas sp.]